MLFSILNVLPPLLIVFTTAEPGEFISTSPPAALTATSSLREEIGVEAGAAGAFRRVDAVVEHAVLVADAEALVAGLLALVAAADVEAVHAHAGRLAEHGPDVGRGRDADQLVSGEVGADLRRLHVDDRRCAGDGHRFLQRGNLELAVDGQNLADGQDDVLRA